MKLLDVKLEELERAVIRFGENTQSGFVAPERQFAISSAGLLTFASIWPPASCTDDGPPP